jgi:hypothetical protein
MSIKQIQAVQDKKEIYKQLQAKYNRCVYSDYSYVTGFIFLLISAVLPFLRQLFNKIIRFL